MRSSLALFIVLAISTISHVHATYCEASSKRRVEYGERPNQVVFEVGSSVSGNVPSDGRAINDNTLYAIQSSQVGYGQTTSVGVQVTRGAFIELQFSMKVKAIISSDLALKDSAFQNTLSNQEQVAYRSLKESYTGNLRIPFLSYIGVNLDEKVEKKDMNQAAAIQHSYNEKAWAARQIIDAATEKFVQIQGSMWVSGTSFMPTEAIVFIKFAQVKTSDGKIKKVISTSRGDLIAASKSGDPNAVKGTRSNLEIVPI